MPRTKSDTIKAMGLEAYLNKHFAYLEKEFGMKPYDKFVSVIHWSDSDIARLFGKEHPQSASHWRAAYNEEVGG